MNSFVKKELANGFQRTSTNLKPANNNSNAKPATSNNTRKDKKNKKEEVSMDIVISLVQMGFAEEAAFNAVRATKNNFDAALDILSADPFYDGGSVSKSASREVDSVDEDDEDARKTHKFWNDPKNVSTKHVLFMN